MHAAGLGLHSLVLFCTLLALQATLLTSIKRAQGCLPMACCYPFDIPQEGAGLPAYCMLVYHLALLIPFSAQQRATFVWGGCMLLRADCLRPHDRYGILQGGSWNS
eukprot:1136582-Pelagomonas_calceolata.AAC.2